MIKYNKLYFFLNPLYSAMTSSFFFFQIGSAKLTNAEAEDFYAEHKGKSFFPNLIKFMTSGSIVAAVLEKHGAIKQVYIFLNTMNSFRDFYFLSFWVGGHATLVENQDGANQ